MTIHRQAVRWCAVVLAASAAAACVQPATAQPTAPTANRIQCGRWWVVADRPSRLSAPTGDPTRLRIMDGSRVLWTFQAREETALPVAVSGCRDLTADRVPELIFTTYTGGAHCCTTVYVAALAPRIRMLLTYEAGNAEGAEVVDLNRDGRPELLLTDDRFAYFDDLCFACSPVSIPLVACFSGGRFSDCTARFPNHLRARAAQETAQLRAAMADRASPGWLDYAKGTALGVYVLHVLLGEETRGRRLVLDVTRMPQIVAWLDGHRGVIRRWAATRHERVRSGDRTR